MRLTTWVVAAVLTFSLVGCTGITGTNVRATRSDSAPELAGPPFSDATADQMKGLVIRYATAIKSGSRELAVGLFLPGDQEVVRATVARDLANARSNPESAVMKTVSLYWLAGGMLAPRGYEGDALGSEAVGATVTGAHADDTLNPGAREAGRLKTLAGQYTTSALVVFEPQSGESIRFFAVESDGKYYLMP